MMIGVVVPFHPDIPRPAWLGAFILFLVEAEMLFAMVERDRRDGMGATDDVRRARSRRLLIVASAMAVLLVAAWAMLLIVL